MKEYNGVKLEDEEVDILSELTEKLNFRPFFILFDNNFEYPDYDFFQGYIGPNLLIWHENHHIVGLLFDYISVDSESLPKSIGNFSKLRSLKLNYSEIEFLPKSFKKLQNLEIFELIYYQNGSGSPDEVFPNLKFEFNEVFSELQNLRKITIHGHINVYFPPYFIHIPRLEEIILEYCCCFTNHTEFLEKSKIGSYGCYWNSNLPVNLYRITSLKKLILTEINIDYLPTSLVKLRSLKELQLRQDHSSNLRSPNNFEIVFKIGSLEKLIIYKYKVEFIPEFIKNLKNLKEIHFIYSINDHVEKPRNFERIFEIKSLKKVTINGFGKEILSDSIGNLINLKELNISHNHLQNFPVEIIKCQKIEFLDLTLNNFKSELTQLNELPNLNHLIISNKHQNLIPKNLYSKKNLKIEFKW